MNKLLTAFLNMDNLGDIAKDDTMIHQLHPLVKLIGSLLTIIFILSTYSLFELLIYAIVILIIAYFSHISYSKLIKRGLIGLPLSLCLGISFIIFNHQPILYYGVMISEGLISCLLVFIKTFLCLCIAYLLISTTSFDALASELVHLKIPSFFVLQLTMTYRYIFVFLKEAQIMSKSYLLRNPKSRAIDFKDMGSFVGHLLICSMNKSQHIYDCMKCRGFDVKKIYTNYRPFELDNVFLLMMMVGIMILIKVVSL